MKKRRHTPEQITKKLREPDRLLAEGKTIPEVSQAPRDLRAELSPLAKSVRRHESQ